MTSAYRFERNTMSIKAVLFDLDGTLLPMDQDEFVKAYSMGLAKKLAPHGYEPKKLVKSVWTGVKAMVLNDGKTTNEEAFWQVFTEIWGDGIAKDKPIFEEFYNVEFDEIKSSCGFTEKAGETVKAIKAKGFRVGLATNPLFPSVATEKRIRWAGLKPDDFEIYTTYENSSFCKPNTEYYKQMLAKMNISPEEAVMVGNDVAEDMVAEKLGMKVFLLTDCIINKNNQDIEKYPKGSFKELCEFLDTL